MTTLRTTPDATVNGGVAKTGVLRGLLGGGNEAGTLCVVVLEELLPPPALDWVTEYALAQDALMVESPVLSYPSRGSRTHHLDTAARRSRVLFEPDSTLVALMNSQLRRVLPDVLIRMGHALVEPRAIDVQLTVHEDGGHFRAHADAAAEVHPDRRLSYVFFCHREPAAFTGGHLRIQQPPDGNGTSDQLDVQPVANRLALFPSRWRHEVTDVRVASRCYADSRFTVNGWVRW